MALLGSGGLGERAEERVDPQPVGEHEVRPVARIGDPGKVRDPHVLRVRDLDQARLREVPARGSSPSPKPLPTEKDEIKPISFSSLIRCWHRLSERKQRLVIWWVVRTLCSSRRRRT
jgi:hypothetical protein